jgi:hypothetical protein
MSGHSNSNRFKLKFSPDKVDTMIVQAIALLDDLDKEINIYAMRVKVCDPHDLDLRTKLSILLRNGTAGISQRCPKYFRKTWHMQRW